tara:strand:- start:9896 stop:11011 length:1116 start_codon:yes stop_codon:yes gene_type:complete
MHFQIKRDILLKSLNFAHNIIERKNTLPILSNVLLRVKDSKLSVVATDLDLVFYDEIQDLKIINEGSTTTSATVLHDLLRKLPSNLDIIFNLKDENKLNISAENSKFNLLCLPTDNFPNFSDDFNSEEIILKGKDFLSLLNKTKVSMSNDETRHYLNGIFIHITESNGKSFLTGVATDSHRLSSSSMSLENGAKFKSFILPKKTVFQLCNLLTETSEKVSLFSADTKIQFKIGNTKITSKIIDGKFPDYKKVVPANNSKVLSANVKELIDSVERVITVSLDRKEGVKLTLEKDKIQLFVNSSSSGEGKETLQASYDSEQFTVSFNSRYLLDVASEIEDEKITLKLNDAVSPVLIIDNSDKRSYYVIMPMKI